MNTPERRETIHKQSDMIVRHGYFQRQLVRAYFNERNNTFAGLNWYRYAMAQMEFDIYKGLPFLKLFLNTSEKNRAELFRNGFINIDEDNSLSDFFMALMHAFSKHRLLLFFCWLKYHLTKNKKRPLTKK